ncbi:hypothetical protein H4582DRAFT_1826204, partial [Lactarius indigo]
AQSLDVDVMRASVAWLVGDHDSLSLCKLDLAKQPTAFWRQVVRVDISPNICAGESET